MDSAKTYVSARIDKTIKEEATLILKVMNLTISDFIRISLTRVAHDKAIPFDIRVPNAKKQTAMIRVRRDLVDKTARFTSSEELFNELENKTGGKKEN